MHESLPIIPYQPHQLDLDKQQAIKYHHSLGSQCFSDYGVSGQELTKLYDTLILINNYFGFGLLIFYEIFTNMILLTFLGQFVVWLGQLIVECPICWLIVQHYCKYVCRCPVNAKSLLRNMDTGNLPFKYKFRNYL